MKTFNFAFTDLIYNATLTWCVKHRTSPWRNATSDNNIDASCVTCVILSLLEVELACRCAVQRAIIEPKMTYRERKFVISDHNCINHLHGYNNYCLWHKLMQWRIYPWLELHLTYPTIPYILFFRMFTLFFHIIYQIDVERIIRSLFIMFVSWTCSQVVPMVLNTISIDLTCINSWF